MNGQLQRAARVVTVLASVGALAAPVAQAGHQDLGTHLAVKLQQHTLAADAPSLLVGSQPTAIERLIAQEDARRFDPRLYDGIVPMPRRVAPVEATSVGAEGFDWADAAIGAASALGLMLIVAATVGVRSHRRPSAA
jgi:hypothetical protein